MDFLIKNTKGLTLKTKGKYCTEDLVINIDPSLVEGYMEIDELPEVGLPRVLYKLMLEEPEYYIWENDEWVQLNTKGGGGLIEVTELPEVGEEDVVYKLVSKPTVVPNSGYVEKVYFNTSLSEEKIVNLIGQFNIVYLMATNDFSNLIALLYDEEGIIIANEATNEYYFNTKGPVYADFTGWNPNFNGVIEINNNVINNVNGISIGTENDKLTELFSTTPFEAKEEYYLYENNEWVKISGANIVSKGGTVVPNSGYVDKVYFNTDLSVEEVDNILSQLTYIKTPLHQKPISGILLTEKYDALLSIKWDDGYEFIFTNLGVNSFSTIYSSANLSSAGNIGWAIDDSDGLGQSFISNALSNYNGIPVGAENDKLINLISTTPFENQVIKELSGDYEAVDIEVTENTTVDVGAMLDEGKIPMSVTVNVGGSSEDRLKKLLDATKSAYYLLSNYQGKSVDDLIKYDDTENVTNMQSMFFQCKALTEISQLDTSEVTNMKQMFMGCNALTKIPQLNTSKVINMQGMFNGCNALTEIPQLDTSNVTNMMQMFSGCFELEKIPLLNLINTTYITDNIFYNCYKLTNITLLNIKVNLQIGSGTTWGHLLTLDSLINTVKECINVGSARTLTMGTANLEKIASTYVKFTDSSVTTIPTNEKGDVVVCESTDEGAMLLQDYALLKNWTLA